MVTRGENKIGNRVRHVADLQSSVSESIYTPSPWGAEYHALPHRYALGAGSAGPGKTQVLIMEPLAQILSEHDRCYRAMDHEHPLKWGSSTGWALHLRRSLAHLSQTILRAKRIFPAIDPGIHWSEQEKTFTFSSGYRYQFGHCNEADSWQQYYSNEYSIICWDELTQFLEEQWDQVNTRLRSSDPVLNPMLKIRAMSNPITGKTSNDHFQIMDPNWVRKLFVDPAPEGRKTITKRLIRADGTEVLEQRIYLPATLFDNPDKAFVAQYEAQLLGAKPHIRKALLYGDWYFTTGSFFDEWESDLHVVRPFKIPAHWPVFRTLDWGYKTPGCVHWWAMDDEGNLVCFFEYSFQGLTDVEFSKEIREIEKRLGFWKNNRSTITGPADYQIYEERGESSKSKAAVMADNGVFWFAADKKSKKHNCELFTKRLSDHHHGTTMPGIVFFEHCTQAIKTIPTIQTDETGPNRGEVPRDGGPDHWLDSVLFACAYASHGKLGLAARKIVPDRDESSDYWDDEDDSEPAKNDRGRFGYGYQV